MPVTEGLIELPSNAMTCVVVEVRLIEPLRNNWEYAKRTILEYVLHCKHES